MESPKHKRFKTTLDDSSSSDESDCESLDYNEFGSQADIDQVPVFLLSGKWPRCFDEMQRELSSNKSDEFALRVMNLVRNLRPIPLTASVMHAAFLNNWELGVAYLLLFRSRHKYYQLHSGKRWKRGFKPCVMQEFAHADVSVAPSNPSGILRLPMEYAAQQRTFFLDLGMGEGSYMRNMPTELRAGGYEINTNPLMLDQILHNITFHHPTFHFIPMDFSKVGLLPGMHYTLFSWHPGTHAIPNIEFSNVTAFFKGACFENLECQGLRLQSVKNSLGFYSNVKDAAPVNWESTKPDSKPEDDDFLRALASFNLAGQLKDTRKIRSHVVSLEEHLGITFQKWKTFDELSDIISTLPPVDYACWVLFHVKWSLVKCHLLKCCHTMTTRMLLCCGVPQTECRRRIHMLLLSQTT